MLPLQDLRNELVILRLSFDDAIMHGNSIDEIRRVYTQIKGIQHNIHQSKIELGKTKASVNGLDIRP
jgi:hypothetical protein